MKRKIIAVVLAFTFICSVSIMPVYAGKQDKLDKIEDEIDKKSDEVNKKQDEADALNADIEKLDAKIQKLENQIGKYQKDKEKIEAELKKAKEELAKAKEEKEKYQALLDERVAVMYKYGDVGYLEILFSSEDFSDLIGRINSIQSIISFDKDVVEKLQAAENKIKKKEQEIKEKNDKIAQLIKDTKSDKEDLAAAESQKQAAVDTVNSDIKSLKASIAKKEAEAEELRVIIAQSSGGSFTASGKYLWPVPGWYSLSSYFGGRIHPITGVYTYHSGIDIPASTGTPIIAPASGVVTLSSYYGGFGYCVIIDIGKDKNGNRLSMLFGHNSSLLVSQGQTVKKGQRIALAGSTGMSTGPHCHFSVLKNGNYVDPLKYVKP